MKHHVIYVPGLGDHRSQGQNAAVSYWNIFGVEGHYFPMHWNDKEAFAPKLGRLIALIDKLSEDGSKVSLVGTSAGASAVLVAYAARMDKVVSVACVCGKVNHPETIHPARFVENPAFKQSLAELQTALPKLNQAARARIMSVHPLQDGSVPPADTIIPGADERTILSVGHAFSIFVAMVFYAPVMMHFLKRQTIA